MLPRNQLTLKKLRLIPEGPMDKFRAHLALSILLTCNLLTGCNTPRDAEIASPQSWQAHVKPASLKPGFRPAIEQSVYVPIYSTIYHNDRRDTVDLAATLSIRNTDPKKSIILKSIRYYDSSGTLIQDFLSEPQVLGPIASADVVVPRTHTTGGSGANFIVDWMASEKPSMPLIEAVMIALGSANSASFVSRGVTISENFPKPAPTSSTKVSAPVPAR